MRRISNLASSTTKVDTILNKEDIFGGIRDQIKNSKMC